MNLVIGLLVPFLGTSLGAKMCFLYEKRVEPSGTESTAWFCIRRYGGGICVVAADTIHRHVRGNGKICIFTGKESDLYLESCFYC